MIAYIVKDTGVFPMKIFRIFKENEIWYAETEESEKFEKAKVFETLNEAIAAYNSL